MPKRTDIKSILIIGSGPIVIGQGCEFDYSGVQACKALKSEGYRIILVNSNPATIMTDPKLCDATYIEPITCEYIAKIIEKEQPDALLPTMGGQTALNCTIELINQGILQKNSVQLIGANEAAIKKAENREIFRTSMQKIGLEVPKAKSANSLETALHIQREIGFPIMIRSSFTLGGSGSGIANSIVEFEELCANGLSLSPIHEILIEECLLGWKEFELEVVRDKNNNCIIVCSIENIDPMGIHTGDSVTVAPAQTLTDKEYQFMRNAAIEILCEIGVETGGANVQFAINPKTGRLVVIEMNPRVSRSSALASKATGFPIAKVAAKLAVGYTLDELKNDITKNHMPSSFEPTIDYVVTKIPRFHFEKFPGGNSQLTTQMKSVGEVMGIGRTFQESLQKAILSLEENFDGLVPKTSNNFEEKITVPSSNRICYVAEAFRKNMSLEAIHQITAIDPWFLYQIKDLINIEKKITGIKLSSLSKEQLFLLKQKGFSDKRIATIIGVTEVDIQSVRHQFNIRPVFKRIDSCAAEFPSDTAYLYSTYEFSCESNPSQNEKIILLGSGPNRIGQGIEFDYCCVHATLAFREKGYETIMINCNPETVSTDYDIANKLYFEPLTLEHILEIVFLEKPKGIVVHFGGQTPLKLTNALFKAGVPIIGTSPKFIDLTEDRKLFSIFLKQLNIKQPVHDFANSVEEGLQIVKKIGFPLILRPSYVLGGSAMKIVNNEEELIDGLQNIFKLSDTSVLLDKYLEKAIEVDVDAVSDGKNIFIGGILEHIEYAGIHSGDSTCYLPPIKINQFLQEKIIEKMKLLTESLEIIGPINAQFAVQNNEIYLLEVNLRASRTVPFVSKAIGLSLAKMAACSMVNPYQELVNHTAVRQINRYFVKLPVFSFNKFPEVDPVLGPEMKSIGESMGSGKTFLEALCKSFDGIWPIPLKGKKVLLAVASYNLETIDLAKNIIELGFKLFVTPELKLLLQSNHVSCQEFNINSFNPTEFSVLIIIDYDKFALENFQKLRKSSMKHSINFITTIESAKALIYQIQQNKPFEIFCLQETC